MFQSEVMLLSILMFQSRGMLLSVKLFQSVVKVRSLWLFQSLYLLHITTRVSIRRLDTITIYASIFLHTTVVRDVSIH
jgi:hypothetical protein